MEEISLEQLEEMQEVLFKQQCDLDIQKAMVKHFIKKKQAEESHSSEIKERLNFGDWKTDRGYCYSSARRLYIDSRGVSFDAEIINKAYDFYLNLQVSNECDCSSHVACVKCGEEKGLDGDFWKRKD